MPKQLLVIPSKTSRILGGGGIAPSEKQGTLGSFYFAQNLDVYTDPSKATLNPKTVKVSGSTVVDLIKWMASGTPYDTNNYHYDASGNIYKETSGGAWTVDRSGATIGHGAAGQGIEMYHDNIYYPTSTTLGKKGQLDNSPTYNDDFLSDGLQNLDQSATTSGYTYTLPNSISESATALLTFTPKQDPIKEIDVLLASKGTGNWTLTLHDALNNVIGSATVSNASLVSGGNYQPFVFSSPLRVNSVNGQIYHFHLTSTTGDGTVTTGTTSDLSTVSYNEYFGILVSDSNWHPIITFGSQVCIGNERYLAVWDEAVYQPNQLAFPAGYHIRSMALVDEYLAISTWKGSSITSSEESHVFLWDGASTTYDFDIPLGSGAVNGLVSINNMLFAVVGSSGKLQLIYPSVSLPRNFPKLKLANYMEVYPGALTVWKNMVHFGVSGSTDSSDIVQGIYQWFSKTSDVNDGLNMGFTISTGNTTGISIGMTKGLGNKLYISWKDTNGGTSYGVDQVLQTNNPFLSGSMEFLIFDGDVPMMEKLADTMKASHLALNSGESITLGYKLERESTYHLSNGVQNVGDTTTNENVPALSQRFKEIQGEVVLATNVTTSPTVTGWSMKYDDLKAEIATGRRK